MAEIPSNVKDGLRVVSILAGVLMGASCVISIADQITDTCPPKKNDNTWSLCGPATVAAELGGPVVDGLSLKPILRPKQNEIASSDAAAYGLGALMFIGIPFATMRRTR